MAIMAALELDLRALSLEARRGYPAVKDAAEHVILKLRSLSSPSEIAHNDDIVRIFLMACDVKSVKLSVIGLSCLQKLISHDAVAQSALTEILSTLKNHAEITDESVQLKTLQTILIIFQSHLQPENEENMSKALGICLRLLENSKSSDSVSNTAAATFRQAVALIFENVVRAESLSVGKAGSGNYIQTTFASDDVSHNIKLPMSPNSDFTHRDTIHSKESLSKIGKLGLRLLEDLTALAAGGSAMWLRVHSLPRIFSLDILEFVLSNYAVLFHSLVAYEQVLRDQICSLLMTSLRINAEFEGEAGEPSFRRLVLRSVAHVIRLYSSVLVTECEVFLNMLLKATCLDLPLWHRILVLEILRGFCMEARTLRILFQNFDMDSKNTNIVDNMVKALARVISTIQVADASEESLAAVAGMFSSKAKGIEWSMDNDTSNAAVVVASEAHAITLAVEGLLGVVFTVATLTDEAVDLGELESPRYETYTPKLSGKTAFVCVSLVDSTWLTILDALSLILTKSQGEAIILEILKGYQAFTQACGVLHAVEPLNSFLASLCKFTINIPNEIEKRSLVSSPGSKKLELFADQRDSIVLTPKNVQALRTLFNIAHRLHNVLGPSWVLVLETLAALDRAINSPHAAMQEVASSVPRLSRELSGQNSDFNILSSLNSQLFESSALMHISSVKSLLSALRQLSNQCNSLNATGQQTSSISFSVERMTLVLQNNLHRAVHIWDQIVDHLLELAVNQNPQFRNIALEALDRSICSVLGSDQLMELTSSRDNKHDNINMDIKSEMRPFESAVLSPLRVLYTSSQNLDVRAGSLKVLLHVLERYGEKLYHSWSEILEMLRSVADALEKDLIPLGFQCVRVVMNDGLLTMPAQCLDVFIDVIGAFSSQKTEINISLTAIGLLWTTTDFIAKGLGQKVVKEKDTSSEIAVDLQSTVNENIYNKIIKDEVLELSNNKAPDQVLSRNVIDYVKLLLSVFSILKELAADDRPEVRNSAIRTLFQILGGHGQKLSRGMWEDCLWNYVFPILDRVSQLAATSSRDEWQGKELGTRGGKAVHMLIHHSRNTAQKQWDETLVLVLGGITRILKSFFPFLQTLSNFSDRWDSLLNFVKDSISNGSKEVALAAVNCLQSIITSHCPKGNLSMPYLRSILHVYVLVFENYHNYTSSGIKVKQEILHGLGDLYFQAQSMFHDDMYLQLLMLLQLAIRQSMSSTDNTDNDFECVSPVQRTILEILPLLCPTEHLSTMWFHLLQGLICYLPGYDGNMDMMNSETVKVISEGLLQEEHSDDHSNIYLKENPKIVPKNPTSDFLRKAGVFFLDPDSVADDRVIFSSYLFGEKLLPVLVNIYLDAPAREKCVLSPDIIKGLGRCLVTRRDSPNSMLWRVAVEGFNHVLIDDITKLIKDCDMDPNKRKSVRIRFWKEIADIYEIFLVNSCGRALSSDVSSESLKSDESLEMTILDVLGDKILKAELDAPIDSMNRLIVTLDRCASRTGSLSIETVGLLPPHCSRFSLCCLQKIFSLCRYNAEEDWHKTRLEICKISIPILMNRCECIITQFLSDENDLGDYPFPSARLEEMVFLLRELALLIIHSETSCMLQLQQKLKDSLLKNQSIEGRSHLLFLLPSFCDLTLSRSLRIRELVHVLLKLVSEELGLQKTQ